ncbi:MAG: TetR/AcrR family transcriptional regulator [Planctomycetes bacterium]|nr:TetR/AcrR family transcriptional regulator [Planctomycetota bacterium]
MNLARARSTPDLLLDAAERLFAERGFDATSLRDVTRRAKANLASVHYHFGSKKGLIHAVIQRRLDPLNRERLRRLDLVARRGRPELQAILDAFLAPTMSVWQENPHFMRLAGRILSEPDRDLLDFFLAQFDEIVVRFRAALVRAVPDAPVEELFWRMHFVIGAMCHTWTASDGLEKISGGRCRIGDGEKALRRLVDFCTSGFRAPLNGKEGR